MTERVDIEVNDKVDDSIVTKLREIVEQANLGASAVKKLQAEINRVSPAAQLKLAAAAAKVTTEVRKQALAQEQLTAAAARTATAQAKASAADSRAALEKQRLATETERTAAAAARAQGATDRLAQAQARAAAAASQQTAEQRRNQAAADALRAEFDPLGAALARLNAQLVETDRLMKAGAISADLYKQAQAGLRQQIDQVTAAQAKVAAGGAKNAASMKNQAYIAQNLIFQLNDVAVGLASGQKPLTVLIQQGSQLATMFPPGTNALKALGAMLGSLVMKFLPIIALLGAAAVAVGMLTSAIQKATGNKNVDFGDTIGASIKVMGDRIAEAVGQVDGLKQAFEATYNFIAGFFKNLIVGAAAIINVLGGLLSNLPKYVQNAVVLAWNFIIDFIQNTVNLAIDAINVLIGGLNAIPSLVGQKLIDPIEQANFAAVKGGLVEVTSLTDIWTQASQKANAGVDKLFADIAAEASKMANAKTDAKRAAELAKVNAELDSQLKNMRMLSDAREVQNQVDAIANKFAADKIPLSAAELAGVRAKIQAIQDYKREQKALDRIVEDSTGPQRDYDATMRAATDALKRGAITQADFTRETNIAAIALRDATDPLAEYKDSLRDSQQLLKYYGDELTAQTAAQAVFNDMHAKGTDASATQQVAILNEQRALVSRGRTMQAVAQAYEDAIGPARDYKLTLQANFGLLLQGVISQDQYTMAVNRATDAYKQATDANYSYNIAQAQTSALLKTVGIETDVLSAQQQRFNDLVAFGTYKSGEFALFLQNQGASIRNTVLANNALAQSQQAVNSILSDITAQTFYVDNYAAMYAQIEEFRKADVANHALAEKAKAELTNRLNAERLNQASSFFGEFTALQKSSNKKIAAIGKAAAISQAIIDGVLGVQKALSAYPPPFNFIAAAGVAAVAATNVAQIRSQNVGNFKDGGSFVVGGRPGVDANNINMNVTRGERVTVETAAQQRQANAGNSGAAPSVTVPVKVVNVIDPEETLAALNTPSGEAVVLNILRRNPEAVKQAGNK